MKFIKRQSLQTYLNPLDGALVVTADDVITTNTKKGFQTPSGNSLERNDVPRNGELRYNTQLGSGGELEVFVSGRWEIIRTTRQQNITVNTFTNSNYLNTIFGPLQYDVDPTRPQNVFVYIENVYQIPATNYELKQSILGNPLTTSTVLTANANFGDTVLNVASVADFSVGQTISGVNLTNNVVVETSATDNTITITPGALGFIPITAPVSAVFLPGSYVQFKEDAVPAPSKPITVIQGFDGYGPPFVV